MIVLNRRETILAIITLIAVLAGVTYWFAQPRYEEWSENRAQIDFLMRREAAALRMLNQRDELNQRLATLRERLPRYPREVDVTAQLLRNMQRHADEHGLTLLRREPEPERSVGDLFEIGITCSWEGELTSLVHFLYALHAQGGIVDVRQLTITPVQGNPNRLRGNFTVDYAYSREGIGP